MPQIKTKRLIKKVKLSNSGNVRNKLTPGKLILKEREARRNKVFEPKIERYRRKGRKIEKFIVLRHPQSRKVIYKVPYSKEKYRKAISNFKPKYDENKNLYQKDFYDGKFSTSYNSITNRFLVRREWNRKEPPKNKNFIVYAFYEKNGKKLRVRGEEIITSGNRKNARSDEYDTIKAEAVRSLKHKVASKLYGDYDAVENVEDYAERNKYKLKTVTMQYIY